MEQFSVQKVLMFTNVMPKYFSAIGYAVKVATGKRSNWCTYTAGHRHCTDQDACTHCDTALGFQTPRKAHHRQEGG